MNSTGLCHEKSGPGSAMLFVQASFECKEKLLHRLGQLSLSPSGHEG